MLTMPTMRDDHSTSLNIDQSTVQLCAPQPHLTSTFLAPPNMPATPLALLRSAGERSPATVSARIVSATLRLPARPFDMPRFLVATHREARGKCPLVREKWELKARWMIQQSRLRQMSVCAFSSSSISDPAHETTALPFAIYTRRVTVQPIFLQDTVNHGAIVFDECFEVEDSSYTFQTPCSHTHIFSSSLPLWDIQLESRAMSPCITLPTPQQDKCSRG